MKRFSFEADMNKGECYGCPLCEYDFHNDVGTYYCAMDHSAVTAEVDRQDCPLAEGTEYRNVDFSDDELYAMHGAVIDKIYDMGKVQDPRIEELVSVDDRISDALGLEPSAHDAFINGLNSAEEWHNIASLLWHPYPAEKPPRWDYFLVTIVTDTGRRLTHERLWFESEWKAGTDWRNYTVVAWAEMPKPYKEEKK